MKAIIGWVVALVVVATFVAAFGLGLWEIVRQANHAREQYYAAKDEQHSECVSKIKAMKLPPTEIEAAMRVCASSCGKLP